MFLLADLNDVMSPAMLAILVGIFATILWAVIKARLSTSAKKLDDLHSVAIGDKPIHVVKDENNQVREAILQRTKLGKLRAIEIVKQTAYLKHMKNGGKKQDDKDPSNETAIATEKVERYLDEH